MSILSKEPDGFGFYYGFAPGDRRQINVISEDGLFRTAAEHFVAKRWTAYVDGEPLEGGWPTKSGAEEAALAWIKANPET